MSVKFALRLEMEFLASESCATVLERFNFKVWFSVLMELSWVYCWVWLAPVWVTKVVIWLRRLTTSVCSESSRWRVEERSPWSLAMRPAFSDMEI